MRSPVPREDWGFPQCLAEDVAATLAGGEELRPDLSTGQAPSATAASFGVPYEVLGMPDVQRRRVTVCTPVGRTAGVIPSVARLSPALPNASAPSETAEPGIGCPST